MTPEQVKQMIEEYAQTSVFTVARVPYHLHNGIDSPLLPSTSTNLLSAHVKSDGTALKPFPAGWTVSTSATGIYTIVHNLGTTDYCCFVSAEALTGFYFINPSANQVVVITSNTSNVNTNANFSLLITQ